MMSVPTNKNKEEAEKKRKEGRPKMNNCIPNITSGIHQMECRNFYFNNEQCNGNGKNTIRKYFQAVVWVYFCHIGLNLLICLLDAPGVAYNTALDEVPKNFWVNENLFSDRGINFLDSNFIKGL